MTHEKPLPDGRGSFSTGCWPHSRRGERNALRERGESIKEKRRTRERDLVLKAFVLSDFSPVVN